MLKTIWRFIVARIDEKSTLRAITLGAGFISWKISPEHAVLISEVVAALLVTFGIMPDKKKTPAEIAKEAAEEKAADLAALKQKLAKLEGKI